MKQLSSNCIHRISFEGSNVTIYSTPTVGITMTWEEFITYEVV